MWELNLNIENNFINNNIEIFKKLYHKLTEFLITYYTTIFNTDQ